MEATSSPAMVAEASEAVSSSAIGVGNGEEKRSCCVDKG